MSSRGGNTNENTVWFWLVMALVLFMCVIFCI